MKIILLPIQLIFDLIFFLLLIPLVIFSWLRFFLKKVLKIQPRVCFSFAGIPMSFLSARAVKTQNWPVTVFSLTSPAFFKSTGWGVDFTDRRFVRVLLALSDYVPIFIWALFFYDIFEFSFRGGFLIYSNLRTIEPQLLKLCAKKVVIYGYGADCKILADIKKSSRFNNAMDRDTSTDALTRKNLRRGQKYADVLIGEGDLIHLGPKNIMLPLAADLSNWKYQEPRNHKPVVFIHSTNHRTHKGSRFIINAFERLKKTHPEIKFMLIEGKTTKECRRLYRQGDVFITDVVTGWHGLTACEAMALGKPVISYLRPKFRPFHRYYAKDIPIQNANPITLGKQIVRLGSDYKLRQELSKKCRDYVCRVHSLETVGQFRTLIYEYLWAGRKINQKIFEKEVAKRGILG